MRLSGRGQTLIQRWAKAMQASASVVSYLKKKIKHCHRVACSTLRDDQKGAPPLTEV